MSRTILWWRPSLTPFAVRIGTNGLHVLWPARTAHWNFSIDITLRLHSSLLVGWLKSFRNWSAKFTPEDTNLRAIVIGIEPSTPSRQSRSAAIHVQRYVPSKTRQV